MPPTSYLSKTLRKVSLLSTPLIGIISEETSPRFPKSIGKAVLAVIEKSHLSRLLDRIPMKQLTPKAVNTRASLLAHMELTTARGYSSNKEVSHDV